MSFWLEIVALVFLISAGTCIRGDTTCNADRLLDICFADAINAGTIPSNELGINYELLMSNLLLGHGCSIPSCNDFAQGLSNGSECMANGQRGDDKGYFLVPQTVVGKAIQTQCQVLPPDYIYTSRNCTAEENTVIDNLPDDECFLSIPALTGNSSACNKCKFTIDEFANTNNCDYFGHINMNLVGKLSQSVCELTTDSTPAPTPSDSTPAPTPSSTDDASVTGDASKSMALSMVAIFGIFGLAFLN